MNKAYLFIVLTPLSIFGLKVEHFSMKLLQGFVCQGLLTYELSNVVMINLIYFYFFPRHGHLFVLWCAAQCGG